MIRASRSLRTRKGDLRPPALDARKLRGPVKLHMNVVTNATSELLAELVRKAIAKGMRL